MKEDAHTTLYNNLLADSLDVKLADCHVAMEDSTTLPAAGEGESQTNQGSASSQGN